MSRPEQSIADQVRLRRLELGWTQEQLAQRAGVTLSTIRNIERGRTTKSYRLRDVFEALGLPWDDQRLADVDDETLVKELRRRHGKQTADALRGYLEERSTEDTEPDTSQSGNDSACDDAAS